MCSQATIRRLRLNVFYYFVSAYIYVACGHTGCGQSPAPCKAAVIAECKAQALLVVKHRTTLILAVVGLQALQSFRDACCTGAPAPSASPASDDPMETDAPAANDTAAQTPTAAEATPPAPPAEAPQDMDTTGSEQPTATTTATTTQAPAKLLPVDPDAASYLPDCVTHTAKLLESMFSNHDTCSKFVQQGGVEVLLQLYTLPKLPPTFGSSSASHSLLAMFRSLTAHNAPDISVRLQPALAAQFQATLSTAEVCLMVSLCMSRGCRFFNGLIPRCVTMPLSNACCT